MSTSAAARPKIVVAVAGGSGSGKTTFGRALLAALGQDRAVVLAQDSYYRDLHQFFDEDGGSVNFDHPDSLEFSLLREHMIALKQGLSIDSPNYDFANHRRLPNTTRIESKDVVIVDGILLLSQPELRPHFDHSIFIDTHETLRFSRRLKRDTTERGRTASGVRAQFFHHVKPMHDLFVEPSKRYATQVVPGDQNFTPAIEALTSTFALPLAPLRP